MRRLLFMAVFCFTLTTNNHSQISGQEAPIGYISSISWSPNGATIAFGVATSNSFCEMPADFYPIRLLDASTGVIFREIQQAACSIYSLDFDTSGNRIATTGPFGITQLWNLNTNERELARRMFAFMYKVEWQPNNNAVLALMDSGVSIYSVNNVSEIGGWVSPTAGTADLVDAVWSPDGSAMAGASTDGNVFIWNVAQNQIIGTFHMHESGVTAVAWHPNGQLIASADTNGNILVWNSADGSLQSVLTGHVGEVRDLDWNVDGTSLVSAGADGTVRIWNTNDTSLMEIVSVGNPVWTASYSPYGGRLAFGGDFQLDATNMQSINESVNGSAIQIVVPDPSLERLQSIGDLCDAPLTIPMQADQLSEFITQIEALPADSIPPACAADLIAVAEAIRAGE